MHKHYEKGRRRPLHQHVFGKIGSWLPTVSRFAPVINKLQNGPLRRIAERFLQLDPDAALPQLAGESFAQWLKKQSLEEDDSFYWLGEPTKPSVILWTDTVNKHYSPHILQSTINILLKSGNRVGIAKAHFCCGRPLYDYGFLDKAKQQMANILKRFDPIVSNVEAIIVLEPSCLSTFNDELLKLFPKENSAIALSEKMMSLSQYLVQNQIKPLKRLTRGVLHLHCHDKSLLTDAADREFMNLCFESLEEPEVGCCGMAGVFGMQKKTRHIALKLLNRSLLPAIKNTANDTVIVSNGFSCRHHIESGSKQTVLHPVQVIEQCI